MNIAHKIRSVAYKVLSYIDIFLGGIENGTAILCYHSFESSTNRYAVSLKKFEDQVSRIYSKSGFVSLSKALSVNKSDGKNNQVLLTIDDGLKSVLDILPITTKLKIAVVLFVLSNPEKADRRELDTKEKFLSWSDIKHLQSLGWEIGCHSSTHVNFSNLSEKQIENEIVNSKKIIESKLGKEVTSFAYPKGIHDERVKDAVKNAGYKNAFSVLPGRVTSKTDTFDLPRTIIDQTHQLSDFPALYSKSWLIFRRLVGPLQLWEKFLS